MAYLLDANVFISAKNLHYGMDFCPAFWEWLMTAKSLFLQIADYYLVAQALAGSHVVVTHEQPQNSVNRIKIPNVCIECGVKYINPFEMLRREQARFVLGRLP